MPLLIKFWWCVKFWTMSSTYLYAKQTQDKGQNLWCLTDINSSLRRRYILAYVCSCNFSCCCCKSGDNLRYFLNYKAGPCTWMFPQSQGYTYIKELPGADIHSRYQLDPSDTLHHCHSWISSSKSNWQRLWWVCHL